MAPVFISSNPSCAASIRAAVDFPDPAYPSMVMIIPGLPGSAARPQGENNRTPAAVQGTAAGVRAPPSESRPSGSGPAGPLPDGRGSDLTVAARRRLGEAYRMRRVTVSPSLTVLLTGRAPEWSSS